MLYRLRAVGAKATYELDAFNPNLARAEADLRIAMLTAKLTAERAAAYALSGIFEFSARAGMPTKLPLRILSPRTPL